jgi:hypothetical protein
MPDAEKWFAFFDGLYDLYRQSGPAPARARFSTAMFSAGGSPDHQSDTGPGAGADSNGQRQLLFERELGG